MTYQRLLLLATLCAAGAFLILVLRIAYPHHRQLAIALYGVGWIPFIWAFQKLWKIHIGNGTEIRGLLTYLFIGLTAIAFIWVFKVLIPTERSSLANTGKDQLSILLEADLHHLAFIDQKMQAALKEIQESPLIEAAQISTTEAKILKNHVGPIPRSQFGAGHTEKPPSNLLSGKWIFSPEATRPVIPHRLRRPPWPIPGGGFGYSENRQTGNC